MKDPHESARSEPQSSTNQVDKARAPLLGQQLLQENIQEMQRLRHEYHQAYALIDRLWQELAQRETELDQRLSDAMSLLGSLDYSAGDGAQPGGQGQPLIHLHAQTLGRFALTYQGKALSLGSSRKGQAVLRYLVTRSDWRAGSYVLLDLFWPGEPPERAKHKLHIAVSKLRLNLHQVLDGLVTNAASLATAKALESTILFDDDCYSLHPALQLDTDANQFSSHCSAAERLLRAGQQAAAILEYRAAVDLYRGDFMPEDLYADWAIGPRARLEEMYITALGHLANDHFDRDEYAQSIACCRQILERDSFREDAYRQLMRCYSRLGRRNQALREFAACTKVLQQELGVGPMRETVELKRRIASEEPV